MESHPGTEARKFNKVLSIFGTKKLVEIFIESNITNKISIENILLWRIDITNKFRFQEVVSKGGIGVA